MEGYNNPAFDRVPPAARDDISSSMERKKTLMALLPLDDPVLESFMHYIIRESRMMRKRVMILCPQRQIQKLRTITKRVMDSISPESILVAIDTEDLICRSENIKVNPSDIVHYCYTEDCLKTCSYQSGFSLEIYRTIKDASGSLEGIDEGAFRDNGMCPSHTLIDIASEANVLIFDHSLLIVPGMERAFSHIGLDPAETVLCIMDPVSLIEKIWDVHSISITSPMLQTSSWPFNGLSEKEINAMETLFVILRRLIDSNANGSGIDRKQLIDDLRNEMKESGLRYSLTDIAQLITGLSSGGSDLNLTDRMRLRYLERFITMWFEQHSTVSRYVLNEFEKSINISLVAPQVITSSISGTFHSSIIFGDNVYPHDIFTRMLGLPLNRVNNRTYISAKNMKDISVLCFTNVDLTSRPNMDEQYQAIAGNIELIRKALNGRKLFVFPSYNHLENTIPLLSDAARPLFEESKHMKKDEKERVLEDYKASMDGLGLTVQNGTLARAFEAGSVDVATAVIVGLQFNPPSPESYQTKIFFHDNYGSNAGELISRILPAMQKAMRMVNAQMYAGEGKRSVILMDRRYQDRRNMDGIPPFWDVKYISDPGKLRFDLLMEG